MNTCRLIVDEPNSGTWNMSADEYLLESASTENQPTLRLYRWSQPTLSLGYFQSYNDRDQHEASRDCPCVRRHSGGGAILHDHELTYSLTMPATERWGQLAHALYDQVHNGLRKLYKSWGADAELSTSENGDAFLCFQRRAIGDILIGSHKVTGSAQRRHKQVTLQHGSILLRRSEAALELPGIGDLIPKAPSIDEVIKGCTDCLTEAIECEFAEYSFQPSDYSRIHQIEKDKFGRAGWTKRR